ncbi:hypothetical protein N7G274_007411 [Stereocaulon virgatum]|uniref:BZIP domain-containing protein n=1 Tax=Stereocaulon virgatum TaxID=373712 RepID=A0ABR4A4K5_9LECA
MPLQQPKPSNEAHSSSPTPNTARVRDNQRRSRARRKEYLQELEAKLRRCEASGVQASVDVQIAARAVSSENTRLREENVRLKDENWRLKEQLKAVSEEPPVVVADSDNRYCLSSPLSIAVAEPGKFGVGDHSQMLSAKSIASSPTTTRHLPQNVATNLEPSMQSLASSNHSTRRFSQNRLEAHDPIINDTSTHTNHSHIKPETQPDERRDARDHKSSISDDTSSCEYAAHIITSMRADVSAEEVRADLGCGPNVEEWPKCKVNNAKLFVAMDRYTR